jgi:hypothetical protein
MLKFHKLILSFVLAVHCLVFFSCLNDKGNSNPQPEKFSLIKNDTLIQFYVRSQPGRSFKTVSENKLYTWYTRDSIYHTRGAYSGKILHGTYMEFYPDRALKTKGTYKNGLKDGVWKTWYQNGETESVMMWKDGLKNGKLQRYAANGKLIEEANFKLDVKESPASDSLVSRK